MEKFMFLLLEDLVPMGRMTDEERFAIFPEVMKWIESIARQGKYVIGQPLAISGRYVTADHIISDGPFIESKEGISGYNIIWANSIDEAAAIAQSCPMVAQGTAVIEVRPIQTNLPG